MSMDEDSFLKRFGRYMTVGASTTGLAGSYAWHQAFSGNDGPDKFAAALYEFLARLRGPLVKAAQLIAMVPDFLPESYTEKLLSLQSNAPAMNKFFVRRRLRHELGENWADAFRSFDETAQAAASLGQVHKAVDLNGQTLACKLQYPDMESVVKADLAQLKALLSLYHQFNKGLDHSDIFREIEEHLLKELDYTLEAKNVQAFRRFFSDADYVRVPDYVPTLSTKKLLTLSWLEGTSIRSFFDASQDVRNTIAERLFRCWYHPLYGAGILHGDPHMGNYQIDQELRILLFDFGCVRTFDADFVSGSLELYQALKEGDRDREVVAYQKWGFKDLSKDIIATLGLWSSYLYAPLLEDRVRPIEENYSSQRGRQIAAEVARQLRAHGGVRPPRTFVFMDRAAVGLGSVFMHLKAELNWHQLFEQIVSQATPNQLLEKQACLGL